MADGPHETPALDFRRAFLWTDIFRCFQVALDPRKLLVAALGILLMSLGWHLLSRAFYHHPPNPNDDSIYTATAMQRKLGPNKPDNTPYTSEEYAAEGRRRYDQDLEEWKVLHDLAGPNGRLRTLPWYEYRGENPYLLLTKLVGGTSVDISTAFSQFLSGTVPVLVEPLRKLLLPIVRLIDPDASTLTRFYLLLCLLWNVAVWAFCGGIITRIAAVQFAGRERVSLAQAVRFVATRYTSYLLSPVVPLGVIAVIVLAMALYGLVAMVPILGDLILYGLGMPLVMVGGIAIAVLLVGLIGYPLMYPTVSAEGSDTFDALSRSYNYVFQAPWHYLWYNLVAILYGAAVVFFVVFMGSLVVYMGKWAVSQAPWSEASGRKPDFLFVYAPESFGWKQLLLDGSPIAVEPVEKTDEHTGRKWMEYVPENPETFDRYKSEYTWWNWAGAGMTTFWMVAVFLLVIGFSYSYSWSAATMIYLLMRKKVDETEMDEVYVEDEQPEVPYTTP
ncbi:MAG TPA: hypothetical protein VM533_19670, partial [Fimbriiglobus sp.]|nr:hypothetical protein [Fimbriiglobus sp.]